MKILQCFNLPREKAAEKMLHDYLIFRERALLHHDTSLVLLSRWRNLSESAKTNENRWEKMLPMSLMTEVSNDKMSHVGFSVENVNIRVDFGAFEKLESFESKLDSFYPFRGSFLEKQVTRYQ
jgi:hypothetical protein